MKDQILKPGYYVDRSHCLWVVYPNNTCDFHFTFAFIGDHSEWTDWVTGDVWPDDQSTHGLEFLGDL